MNTLNMSAGLFLSIVLSVVTVGERASADELRHSIRIVGRKQTTITTKEIRLSDVAEISSDRHEDTAGVIAAQKLVIDPAPAPGEELNVSGSRIVERMKEAGFDLDKIGYLIPKSVLVKRAFRDIQMKEVRDALEKYLEVNQPDVVVKRIDPIEKIRVSPNQVDLSVKQFRPTHPGHIQVEMTASREGEQDTNFRIGVAVEAYGDVPIAKRSIPRGATVGPNDIAMARMNLSLLPRDTASAAENVVGLATAADVALGEVFRQAKLEVPIVVKSGSRVVLRVRSGALEATARGTALDSGGAGQQIRVRNDSSKKIVTGAVKEDGIVEVTP